MCTDTDSQALDTAIAAWTARRSGPDPVTSPRSTDDRAPDPLPADLLRLNGKTVRGAVNADSGHLHLLAALAGSAEPGAAAV